MFGFVFTTVDIPLVFIWALVNGLCFEVEISYHVGKGCLKGVICKLVYFVKET